MAPTRRRPRTSCYDYNWSIDPATGDWNNLTTDFPPYPVFTFTNMNSGLALQAPSGSATCGATGTTGILADQSDGDGGTDQQWMIIDVPHQPSNMSYIPHYEIMNVSDVEVLEVQGSGPCLDLAQADGDDNQLWEFVAAASGTGLTLKNVGTGQLAEVPSDSTAAGATLDEAPGAQPAPTPNQQWALNEAPGYWAFTAHGNVNNEAGTPWFGSLGSASPPASDVVGMATTPDGEGYWLIESQQSGGATVKSYGDAASVADITAPCPVTGATTDPAGGFWAFSACGDVFPDGGAPNLGSAVSRNVSDITGLAAVPGGGGYWLIGSNDSVYPFGIATAGTSPGSANLIGAVADPKI
jgi:Ricin-type beta-trefoil lectin domain-like